MQIRQNRLCACGWLEQEKENKRKSELFFGNDSEQISCLESLPKKMLAKYPMGVYNGAREEEE